MSGWILAGTVAIYGLAILAYTYAVRPPKQEEGMVGMSEWISVEDRLPTEEQSRAFGLPPHVLAVCKHKHGDVYVASRTYSTLNRQWISHDPVTHWMPLPEPPEPKP